MAMHGTPSILPLELHGVSYAVRGQRLIDGVDMTFAAGSRTVIMGPNGAGKSLTLRLCHGLIRPTAGQIVWTGQAAPNGCKPHALVFQRPVLLRRSALANLTHALSVAGVGRADRRRRAQDALVRFGLENLADRPARVMSGGEQQRLAMARAWALAPQVLFLDEPTASLDPAATRAIEGMIAAFHGGGVKIVMTTHDLGQARRLADEVIFLHHGRILEQTPAVEFWDTPRTAAAQAFIRGELLW
jgi:tungstate transport system ATP-binding protein